MGFGTCSDLYSVVHADGQQLTQAVSAYFALIPRTARNEKLLNITKQKIAKLNDLMQRLDSVASDRSPYIMNPFTATIDTYRIAYKRALTTIDRMNPKMTVEQLLDAFDEYDDIVEALLSSQSATNAMANGSKH